MTNSPDLSNFINKIQGLFRASCEIGCDCSECVLQLEKKKWVRSEAIDLPEFRRRSVPLFAAFRFVSPWFSPVKNKQACKHGFKTGAAATVIGRETKDLRHCHHHVNDEDSRSPFLRWAFGCSAIGVVDIFLFISSPHTSSAAWSLLPNSVRPFCNHWWKS